MTTLRHGDLKGCVYPEISVDEYESKIGDNNEVIVVAFYVMEEDVGIDLDDFLEKSWLDILDVDVSPNPNPDGKYMVFVEFKRDSAFFDAFGDLVKEVENLSGPMSWVITTRGNESTIVYGDKQLSKYIDVSGYVPTMPDDAEEEAIDDEKAAATKDAKEEAKVKESVLSRACKLMDNSGFLVEQFDSKMKLTCGRVKMYLDIVDFDGSDKIIERNSHIPMSLESDTYEANVLRSVLGTTWSVLQLNEHISLHNINSDEILIVRV